MGRGEVEFVMRELGYQAISEAQDLVIYVSELTPHAPVVLDLGEERITLEDLRQDLLDNGFPNDLIAAAFEQLG